MKERLTRLWDRLKQTEAWQAWTRFGKVRGNLLASGIAFYGFFSIFPALALAAVVFGFVLRGHPELISSLGDALNRRLPGFVKTASNPSGLVELKAPDLSLLTIGGAGALVGLVLAGIGWIGAMRDGIRAIFGLPGSPGNVVTDKLRDLGVLVTLGVGVLLSAVLTSVIGAGASGLSGALGLGDHPVLSQVVGLVVGFGVDLGVMVVLLRVLSGLPLPWHELRSGALVGAVGLTVVKVFGVQLIGRATANPLFGSVILVVGLLFWLNLIAKLILISASWTANVVEGEPDLGPDRQLGLAAGAGVARASAGREKGSTTPQPDLPDLTDERTRAVAGLPTFGTRAQDRTTLAAGAILGATGALALASAARTVRSLVSRR